MTIALAQADYWERAEALILRVDWEDEIAPAISELQGILARSQQWEQVEAIWLKAEAKAYTLRNTLLSVCASIYLSMVLIRVQQWERAEAFFYMIGESKDSFSIPHNDMIEVLIHPWERMEETNHRENWEYTRIKTLRDQGIAFIHTDLQNQSEAVTGNASWENGKIKAFQVLRAKLAGIQRWDAKGGIGYITRNNRKQAEALCKKARDLAIAGEYEQLLRLVQHSWQQANTREYAVELLSLATELISLNNEIGTAFYKAFSWVNTFFRG